MRPQSQQKPTMYCHLCGTRLEVIRWNASISGGNVRPCPECSTKAYERSRQMTEESQQRTERIKELRSAKKA